MIRDPRRGVGSSPRALLAIAAVFGLALVNPATSGAISFGGASNDGSKVFFTSDEQLVSGDTDGSNDVYERSAGTTTRVSQGEVNGNGVQSASFAGASNDGSRVLFTTGEQLVSADTDSSVDLYERSGGTTTLVSRGEINGNGAFTAGFAGASSDGSMVFFVTAEKMVSADTDSTSDIYERSGVTTTQVSQGEVNGNGAFAASFDGASADGSKVFFHTNEQLVSGDTDSDLDLYERSGGTTIWVSQGEINGNVEPVEAYFHGASSDGSKVLFQTWEQLVSADTDNQIDIYERSGGTTTLVSQGQINGNGDRDAHFHGASSDGSKVFFSTGEQLVSADADSTSDIYERSGGTTTWVSQGEINGNGFFDNSFESATSDGSKVFFFTAEKLVSADADSTYDIYERSGGTTTLVSVDTEEGASLVLGSSSDGSKVFFQSGERLAGGDFDDSIDIYERSGGTTTWISHGPINESDPIPAYFKGSSGDGSKVLFMTNEQLVSGDVNGAGDIYERSGGTTTTLVSTDAAPPNTTMVGGPAGDTSDPTPSFTFSSSDPRPTFQCKLDAGAYAACNSPKATTHLADGSHTFYVRARDSSGNLDPTPATRTFTVSTAEVKTSGSTLVVTAAAGAKDNFVITKPSASTLRVTDLASGAYTGSGVHTGTGCTRSGDYTANCPASGITLVQVVSGDQTDKVTNSTAVKGSLNGGAANDLLTGGPGIDILIGGPNVDVLKGMGGNDDLRARDLTSDTTIDCGGGTGDKADLDLLPKDPNAAVIGCETKTRH